jgi:alkylation response protein AidB-like acyl-CoA dehydrogenase
MDQPGVKTERIHQITGRKEFNQVYLDDARTTDRHIIGEINKGWDVIRTLSAFEMGRTQVFKWKRRLNELIHYCQTNENNETPLIETQSVRRKLAKLETRIEAAIATRYRNISSLIDDDVPGPEGSMDLVTSDEIAIDLQNFAMDLLGPEAALWEDGPEEGRWAHDYLRQYGTWVAAGTGDIQRNVIGEQVLNLPSDPKSDYTHRGETPGLEDNYN